MSGLPDPKQALQASDDADDGAPVVKLVVLGTREALAEFAMAIQQPLYLQDHADDSKPDGCRCRELFYIGCWDGQLAPQAFGEGSVIRTGNYPVTRRNGQSFESHGLRPHGQWWRFSASFECEEVGASTLLAAISRAHPDVLLVAACDRGDHSWEMRALSAGQQEAARAMHRIERDDWHEGLPVDLALFIAEIGMPILEHTAARAPGGPGWPRWSPVATAAAAGPAELARAVHAAATAAGCGMQLLLQTENARARRLGVASALDVLIFDAADAAGELPYIEPETGFDTRCRAVLDFLAQHRAGSGLAAAFASVLTEHLADPLVRLRSGLLALPYLAWAASDSVEHGTVLSDINTRMSRRLRARPGLLLPARDEGRRLEGSIVATTLHLLGDHGSVELALAAGVEPQILAVSLRDITDPGTVLRGLIGHFGSALALPQPLLAHLPQLGDEFAAAVAAIQAEERMRSRIDEVAGQQATILGDVPEIPAPRRRRNAV